MPKKSTLTNHTELKDLQVLKVNEKVCFFLNKQGKGHTTWLTGTVSEILDCGHSYTIKGPNNRVYRRNRLHLKPICYDSSTFQTCTTEKEDKQPDRDSFQDPKPKKGENYVLQNRHSRHHSKSHDL